MYGGLVNLLPHRVIDGLDFSGGNRRVPRLREGFGGPKRGRQAAHQGRTYGGKAGSAQQEGFPRREVSSVESGYFLHVYTAPDSETYVGRLLRGGGVSQPSTLCVTISA